MRGTHAIATIFCRAAQSRDAPEEYIRGASPLGLGVGLILIGSEIVVTESDREYQN